MNHILKKNVPNLDLKKAPFVHSMLDSADRYISNLDLSDCKITLTKVCEHYREYLTNSTNQYSVTVLCSFLDKLLLHKKMQEIYLDR